jgi:hypothetical protein
MTKNPAAVALGRLRAAKGDLAAVGSLGGLAARGKPRKRQPAPRCACGKMTLARAEKRGHKCKDLFPPEVLAAGIRFLKIKP